MEQSNDTSSEPAKVTTSYCRSCGGMKNHGIIASAAKTSDADSPVLFRTTFDLLKCLGCDAISVRRDEYCDDPAIVYPTEGCGEYVDDSNGRHDFDYWPSVEKRPLPEWLWELKDSTLRETLLETYKAFNEGLPILAAAGSRIVFDLLANLLLKRDAGSFAQKLDAMHQEGHISLLQKETLSSVVDAGSAAQHRAHKVAHHDLILILAILESLIHQTILADAKAADLRKRTPQRKDLRQLPQGKNHSSTN